MTDNSNKEQLMDELKQLIVEECDVDLESHEIENHERLIGEESRLDLDSLDALSISLEVKSRYGKHIDSGNETRMALASVDALADFILAG
ncbi:acyl carrier protein [Aestuariicella sp. G3-2]|uniref:acyl carrier protein n=1 Tax=Pseudomaricurvus albidus TaxID=2842452 RepID=UPI001C0D83AC|nr:acyl carrier protein [Aestuariicella albida]MBU3068478.1 acyl carrier protein [Aestuariicella albida]